MKMDEIVQVMLNKAIEKRWTPENLKSDNNKKRVNILGLLWLEFWFRGIKCREDMPGDVWTLNDYYRALKWLKHVDKSFELHPFETVQKIVNDPKSERYKGDYQKRFNEDVKEIMVTDIKMREFFNRDVTMMDYKGLHNKYSDLTFGSSIDYMIMYAVEQGYEIIYLYGIFLQNDHHRMYGESLLKTIDKVRSLGKEIVFDWEEEIKALPNEGMTAVRYLDKCYEQYK
jgi:hypothetical protein